MSYDCTTHRRDAHGYYWRYDHPAAASEGTLTAAMMIAVHLATEEARKSGTTYIVARTLIDPIKVYAFTEDHPEFSASTMGVVCKVTPDGKRSDGPWADPKYLHN